jgi:hypothetical protein
MTVGRMVQYPRYNIVSVRLSDTEMKMLEEARSTITRQAFIHSAVMQRIQKEVANGK